MLDLVGESRATAESKLPPRALNGFVTLTDVVYR